MEIKNFVYVFVGGGIGSVLRYFTGIIGKFIYPSLPLGTLFSNILSCLFLGILFGFFSNKWTEESVLKSFIVIGFCGGFSTFSAFTLETFMQLKMNNNLIALGNIFLNFTLSFIFLLIGMWIAKFF